MNSAESFRRVSPTYIWVTLISLLIWFVVGVAAAVIAGIFLPLWVGLLVGGLTVILTGTVAFVAVRQIRALGYQERERDLLIQRGIMFRSTTVVPYGRLQFVDVEAGPLMRMFGLATVTLQTASAATDATVPGLPRKEADHLREVLAQRGESALSGL